MRGRLTTDRGGGNRRDHAQGDLVTSYEVSPDGRTLLFRENYNLFVTPFFNGAATMNVGARGNQLPVTRVTRSGGSYPSWTADGGRPAWTLGPTLFTANAGDLVRT